MCDLEFLQHRDGVVDADAFINAITPKTKALVLSSTQWSNGYRLDLAKLGRACSAAGIWLVVDGIQQASATPFELSGVDSLTAGGHKWLNAPMGTGFPCLSQRVLEQLEPAGWGYPSLEDPPGGWGEYFTTPTITPDRSYDFDHSARRFEIGGTSNYPGAICLGKSLELVNEIGIDNIANRV